jgi:hypothetical protein
LVLVALAPSEIIQSVLRIEAVSAEKTIFRQQSQFNSFRHIEDEDAPFLHHHSSRLRRCRSSILIYDAQPPVPDESKVGSTGDGELSRVEWGEGEGVAGEAVRPVSGQYEKEDEENEPEWGKLAGRRGRREESVPVCPDSLV